jgi:hypothetical protein
MTNTPEAFRERVAAAKARREARNLPAFVCAGCIESIGADNLTDGLCSLCADDARLA